MKIVEPIRLNASVNTILRSGILLSMIVFISIGHLSQYVDRLEMKKIELAEEKDIDSEEKENRQEVEKSDFSNNLLSYKFFEQKILNAAHVIFWAWKQTYGDIPKPPPKVAHF